MTSDIRWGRLVAYLVLLLVVPNLLLYLPIQIAAAVRVRILAEQCVQASSVYVQRQIARFERQIDQVEEALKEIRRIPPPERENAAAEWFADNYGPDVENLGQAEARLDERRKSLIDDVKKLQQYLLNSAAVNHSYTEAITEAVFKPFSSASSGTISTFWGFMPYPAPSEIHAASLDRQSGSFYFSSGSDLPQEILRSLHTLAASLWILIGLPLGFVLLPISRRRAKVRWRHIWRITAYSLFIPATLVPASMLCTASGFPVTGPLDERFRLAHSLLSFPFTIGLIIWWAAAIRRYLRIPHGLAVSVSLAIVCGLLGLGAVWLINPWFVLDFLDLV